MLTVHSRVLAAHPRLPETVYCAGLALLLVVSNLFSSSIQASLPVFSSVCRLAFTGAAVLLFAVKCLVLTRYNSRTQQILLAAVLCYTAFAAVYGGDKWFFLAVLAGVAAKDVPLRKVLTVYLVTALFSLAAVQVLHWFGYVPYKWYCRNWDFGYGHYNGYGARLLGVFYAWFWLRWHKLRWFELGGLAALAAYTHFVPNSRGAFGGMLLLFLFYAIYKLFPAVLRLRAWRWVLPALYPLFTAFCVVMSYLYKSLQTQTQSLFMIVNRLLSGRFEVWERVFWHTPATLLGGVATDGDEHHSIDTIFLALPMNKGVLGALLVGAAFMLLLYRLCLNGHTVEVLCLVSLLCYCLMENKLFLLSANPFVLLLPYLLFPPEDRRAPLLTPAEPASGVTG